MFVCGWVGALAYTTYNNIERIRWSENAPKRKRYKYMCVCGRHIDGKLGGTDESVKRRATKTEDGDGDKVSGI